MTTESNTERSLRMIEEECIKASVQALNALYRRDEALFTPLVWSDDERFIRIRVDNLLITIRMVAEVSEWIEPEEQSE